MVGSMYSQAYMNPAGATYRCECSPRQSEKRQRFGVVSWSEKDLARTVGGALVFTIALWKGF